MEREFLPLVKTIAVEQGVQWNWIAAIIQRESVWNPWVIRYEKDYSYLFDPKRFMDKVWNNYSTEYQAQKISWGLGQIMGGVARELGHTGLLTELLQPEVNIKFICMRVLKLMTLSPDSGDVFAMYNGGPGARRRMPDGTHPNQTYVLDVMHNLQFYKM